MIARYTALGFLSEIKQKTFFLFLQIAERACFRIMNFCQNRYSAEGAFICGNRAFLQKESLSAGIMPFWTSWTSFEPRPLIEAALDYINMSSLPKEGLSAKSGSFCRKAERRFITERVSADISANIFGRKSVFRPFVWSLIVCNYWCSVKNCPNHMLLFGKPCRAFGSPNVCARPKVKSELLKKVAFCECFH